MYVQPLLKTTLTLAALTYSLASLAGNKFVGEDNVLEPGTSIQAIAANSSKNGYTGNPALVNNAWGMQGTWLSFNVPTKTTVVITLSSLMTNAPGFTVYRTDGEFVGKGTGVPANTKDAIHSFNQVAQAGTDGIAWATDDSVKSTIMTGTKTPTANGIVETLGYVNSSGIDYSNAFGGSVKAGAFDISSSNKYESGVFGSVATDSGIRYANLTLVNLAAGYYTIFLGGANSAGADTPIDVKVSSLAASPSDCLFDYAERTYPETFAPAGTASQTGGAFYYRYYSSSLNYLGISATDNHVYFAGPDGKLLDQGDAATWLKTAGCR